MEKIRKKDVVTALNISSARVSACIAALDERNDAGVIGLGKSEGKLLGKKGVLDIDVLSKAIRDSVKMAQEEAQLKSPKAVVSISGRSISSERSRGIIKLSHRGREISDRNIRDVLKIAEIIPINIAREIIHSVPQDYIVDDQNDIKNPVGLHGVKLEVETLLITAHIPFLQNIVKSLNLAGIDLEDAIFSGIATSQCLLTQETLEKGVILLEADNNFTTASFFFDNILRGIDICERHISEDGVFENLRKKIELMRKQKPISKIIIIGTDFIPEETIEKIESAFGIPTEAGYARNAKGRARDITNPMHIASVGLALYGLEGRRNNMSEEGIRRNVLGRVATHIGGFFEEYF
jgi:cell division ATPase FtsA